MSHIQYKFISSKDYSTTIFDGLSISVVDLKQDILRDQKLDPEEYNLVITNEQTNEDYVNDLTLIPKNSTVLVRRVPYTGPRMPRMMNGGGQHSQQRTAGYTAPPFANGGGSAGGHAGYHRGYGAQPNAPANQYGYRGPQGGSVNAHKNNTPDHSAEAGASFGSGAASGIEDAGIEAMLEQSNEQWMHQQSIMEMQRPVYHGRPGGPRPRPHQMRPENQGPPPPHYICHLCGKPGHWIYSCSLIGQPGDGTGKPTGHRVKRTTGIPRSFLQKVDNIEDVGNALVTSDGTLVVAAANEAAWNRAQKMSRNVIVTDELIDPSLIPDSIKCNVCHRIARDAVTTPCCKTVFCSACIERELLEPGPMHFTCPACHAKGVVPDQLETAGEARSKVDEFLREYSLKQQQAEEESERAAREAAAAAATGSGSGSGSGSANGAGASSGASTAAVPSAIGTSVAQPPPPQPQAQQPRPPPPRQQQFGMLPGMLMGMGGGFPGMGGIPMAMGQMPQFMPGGMMMMPPPGMMPPASGWASSGMAQPVGAIAEAPHAAAAAQPHFHQPSDMQTVRARSRSRSRSGSRHRRSRSRDHGDHRANSRRSPRSSHGVRSKSRLSTVDNRDDERRDASADVAYEAPPMDGISARHASEHRGRSRDDSRARRDRRHADEAGSGRHGRYRSREREYEREQRRVRDRDGASQREGPSRGGGGGRRDERSRSPMHARAPRDSGRRNGGSGEHDPGVRHLSIRGQSSAAVAADRLEGGKARSILDRIRDDRPMTYGGSEQRPNADSSTRRQGGSGGGRRRR